MYMQMPMMRIARPAKRNERATAALVGRKTAPDASRNASTIENVSMNVGDLKLSYSFSALLYSASSRGSSSTSRMASVIGMDGDDLLWKSSESFAKSSFSAGDSAYLCSSSFSCW